MEPDKTTPLSRINFSVILALSLQPRHGYELMQQIEQDSGGVIKPGPGALYGALKQLGKDNFIEEMPFEGDARRHYYRLTKKGWDRLDAELAYYQNIIRLARDRHLLDKSNTY